jgi:hypothetical protein
LGNLAGIVACRGFVSKRRRSAEQLVEMPAVGDALQLVFAGVFELQPRAGGEVFHRGAHENLPCVGERADARADVDREAADVVASEFDLTGVAPGADLQAELAGGASPARSGTCREDEAD